MFEKPATPHALEAIGENWPQWDEAGYLAHSAAEAASAAKALQGSTATATMAAGIAESLKGLTGIAAEDTAHNRTMQLDGDAAVHDRNALVTAFMAQNTANSKARITALAAQHETNIAQLEAQAVASKWSPAKLQSEKEKATDEAKNLISRAKQDHDDTHDGLKEQLNGPGDEDVALPPTMPGGPGDGSAPPALEHDPSVADRVADAMGAPTASAAAGSPPGGGMYQLAQVGQQLAGSAAGALQHPPGLDQAGQLPQQIGQMLQGLGQGGAGSEGMSEITPEQLDTLLAGQGDPDADAGDVPPDMDTDTAADDSAADEPEDKPELEPQLGVVPTEHSDTGAPIADAKEQPYSAAVPASAIPPGTHLTADSGATGSALGSSGSQSALGHTAAPGGTHLTSGDGSTGSAVSGGGVAGAGAGAAGGMGAMGGFGGGMAGPGTSLADLRRRLGIERRAAAQVKTRGEDAPDTAVTAGSDAATVAEEMAALPPMAVMPMAAMMQARRIVSTMTRGLAEVGMEGPVAVAVRRDGTAVAVTADGLGVLPSVISAPHGVQMLTDLSLPAQFRLDRAGCVRVGETMRLAVVLGLVEGAVGVVASTREPGILSLTDEDMASVDPIMAPAEAPPAVDIADLDAALSLVKRETAHSAMVTQAAATEALTAARWNGATAPEGYLDTLRTWLAVTATGAATRGNRTTAARFAWHYLQLPASGSAAA